jgi:sugar phosphate isomerase/epimerase
VNYNDFGIDSVSLAGSLETRLAAARQAGFSQVMISADDIVGHPAGTAEGVRTILESGLRVTGLEALRDFEGLGGKMHEYKVDMAKSMLDLCRRIGARVLLTEASTSVHADVDHEWIARDLRKLALLALPAGIRIAFKATSRSRTARDLASAADIVSLADCGNLGLAIDAFEMIAAGASPDELDGIFHRQVFLVQLSDFMVHELRSPEEKMVAPTRFRVFPGEGAHGEEVANFVVKLESMGYLGDYSFDVYNGDYLQAPPEVIAERARRAADWLGERVLRRALPVPNMDRLRSRARD